MRKTYNNAIRNANEYGVFISTGTCGDIYFRDAENNFLAKMFRSCEGRMWTGATAHPEITGKKYGTKAAVADWCMDWAANGF